MVQPEKSLMLQLLMTRGPGTAGTFTCATRRHPATTLWDGPAAPFYRWGNWGSGEPERPLWRRTSSWQVWVSPGTRPGWCVRPLPLLPGPVCSVRTAARVCRAVVVCLHRQALGGDLDKQCLASRVLHLHFGWFRVTEWAGPITRRIGYHVKLIH